jgi:hypothetical protein
MSRHSPAYSPDLSVRPLQLGLEIGKKTFVCAAAAVGLGLALPYSLSFAFEILTYLAFLVALTEGAISVLADLFECPRFALKKSLESIESLGASVLLLIASATIQLA